MTESKMIDAAERLLKESRSDMSLSGLVNNIMKTEKIASENLICDFERSNLLHALSLQGKTVLSVDINKDEKKVDIFLENKEEVWEKIQLMTNESYDQYDVAFIPKSEECNINGLENGEIGVKTRLGVFLTIENEMTKFIIEKMKLFDVENSDLEKIAFRVFVSLIINKQISYLPKDKGFAQFEKNYHSRVERPIFQRVSDDVKDVLWSKIDRDDLLSGIYSQKAVIYDLNDWSRKEQ